MKFSKVVTSSVIRGADVGDSHGGVYIVDLEAGNFRQVLDWNTPDIDWDGRGGDRGLRGIAIYDEQVYMAASDELFQYDHDFEAVDSFRHPLLKHCHEIQLWGDKLYITSTGYNAIIIFDLKRKNFIQGMQFNFSKISALLYARGFGQYPQMETMNLTQPQNYELVGKNSLHINNVFVREDGIYFSGTRIRHVFKVSDGSVSIYGALPKGGHNARAFEGGTLMNDTARQQVVVLDKSGKLLESYKVPTYSKEELEGTDLPERVARQGFGRGLCLTDEGYLVAGSSPATISVFERGVEKAIKSINISKDLRNAIHGLEIWPY